MTPARPGRHEPSRNFAEVLVTTAEGAGSRTGVVDSAAETTFGALCDRALSYGERLVKGGIAPGDRVGILMPRGAEAAAAFFGILAGGGVAVHINESLRPRQIEHILAHAGARFLIASVDVLDRLPRGIETDADILDPASVAQSSALRPARRIDGDVAQIIYTSGSTGLPKGVTISHGNLRAGMEAVLAYTGISADDRIASLLPFSFDYGLNQLLCCAGSGATLVVERSPLPQRIVRTLREQEVTVLPAVPPLWLQLLEVEAFTNEPLALRVMTNTGGRLPTEAVRKLRSAYGNAELFLMYGLTEAFRSTYLSPRDVDVKPNSIGRAIPGAEILVLDEDLHPCPPNEAGELVHRGPTVALGYWNDADATRRVFRPNPLRPDGTPDSERVVFSGDIVRRDADGDLFFVGRRDKLIKTLGYRVSPDEVADVLYASGEVAEALVTSEPDDLRGTRIVAFVVLARSGDVVRLEEFCARELPRYMQPARIEVRASLARTPSGKHDVAATAREIDDRT